MKSMTKKPVVTRSVGLYLIEGFWADKKPDYSKFNSQYWLKPEFWKLMEEEVVRYKHGESEIVVYRDGLVTYSDKELSTASATDETFKRIENYSEILNAIFAVFVSTFTEETKVKYHTNFEVTHHHIVPLTFEDGVQRGMGIPQKSITTSQIDKRLLMNVPSGYEDSLDDWIDRPPRAVIPKTVIEKACKTFFTIAKDKHHTRILARSNKAAAEYASTSFSDCILVSWLQIEVHLFMKLKAYMQLQGSGEFNKERRDSLINSTSAQIIELLEVSNNITKDIYQLLTRVRKVRNKIVHSNYSATIEEASDALKILEQMIKETSGETVRLNTGISMSLF